MSLGKKILPNLGYRTAYKVPAGKKSTVNLLVNAQADSDFKVIVTDLDVDPVDADGVIFRQDFSGSVASGRLGSSVAVDGNYAVVGADGNGGVAGQIQIYFFNGFEWTLQQTITDPANDADAQFGFAVAISGDNIIVGAPGDDQTATSSGRAYRYTRSGTTWSLSNTYAAPETQPMAFGSAVAISGIYILIGAPTYTNNNIGRAYGYQTNSGTNPQVTYTTPSGGTDLFGASVAVWSNGAAVIGSPNFSSSTGRAYYYASFSNTVTTTIGNPNATSSDRFGFTVSCDKTGTRFAVGSDGFSGGASRGRVYTYDRASANTVLQTIENPENVNSQRFGTGLDMSKQGGLLIGAYSATVAGAGGAGKAYRYTRSESVWTLAETFENPFPNSSDNFGFAVAIDEDVSGLANRIVGAPFDDTLVSNGGSVYFYTKTPLQNILTANALEADQITDEVSLTSGQTFERTGLVVDEGESIVVLSRSPADLRITVRGFEEDI